MKSYMFYMFTLIVMQFIQVSGQQVVSTAGSYYQNEALILSSTIGEPVIATFETDEIILTQGFQQPHDFHFYQLLNLPSGWSGVSSYIIPNATQVNQLFTDVESEMIILQNFAGMYWPTAGVNTLGNWNDHAGYQVKMETTQQVTFTGSMQENLTANLSEGWNYLPVLNACDNDLVELFASIIGQVQIVKDVAGSGVYWPQFGINSIGVLQPGKAYFVLVNEDVDLEFPDCGNQKDSQRTHRGSEFMSGFEIINTPISHTIAIPLQVTSDLPEYGILKLFNQFGLCCGAAEIRKHNLAFTAFGDDPTTPDLDGMLEGDVFIFHLFNPQTNTESILDFVYDEQMQNGGNFENNGLSVVKELHINGLNDLENSELNAIVFPNPSSGVFQILTVNNINWEISNSYASVIVEGKNLNKKFTIDISNHPRGIYYLKLTKGNMQTVKKIVLQ